MKGLVDPLSAAQTVDRTIMAQCHDAYNIVSSGERDEAITLGGWLRLLWSLLGSLAMVIPSDRSRQDHLISIL
jgi:hypothetical protein